MATSKIVTAVGVSVNTRHGEDVNQRLERAMADEVQACIAEGISLDERHAAIIRERTQAAYARELAKIESGT